MIVINGKIKCEYCRQELSPTYFLPIRDTLFPNGRVNICTKCLKDIIKRNGGSFKIIDRICQWLGIPFLPDKWIETVEAWDDSAIEIYIKMYQEHEFEFVNWTDAFKYYKNLESSGLLLDNIAPLSQGEMRRLKEKWGSEFDEEQLRHLEHLYQDILNTYSIFGGNQLDQVKKICKVSLLIDEKIRAGEDYSKDIKSYQELSKLANLEAKNIRDATDFSSMGELVAYLEKNKHWLNEFYDGAQKDIVDATIADIQNWSKTFYINESSIPSEIEARLNALKMADELEDELNRLDDDTLDDEEEDFEAEAGID